MVLIWLVTVAFEAILVMTVILESSYYGTAKFQRKKWLLLLFEIRS